MVFINKIIISNTYAPTRKTYTVFRKTFYGYLYYPIYTNLLNIHSNCLHKMYKYFFFQPYKKAYTILFACLKDLFLPPLRNILSFLHFFHYWCSSWGCFFYFSRTKNYGDYTLSKGAE